MSKVKFSEPKYKTNIFIANLDNNIEGLSNFPINRS